MIGAARAGIISGSSFSPLSLFANGERGCWFDPSDLSTLYQDRAGTTLVTAMEQPVGYMLDKSGRGAHATAPRDEARPVVSARYNILLATETLSTQNVTTLAATYTLKFSGTGTIALSGAAAGTKSAGSHSVTCTAGTLTLTVSGSVTHADLRVANDGVNLPEYQRVTTATNYDSAGFPPYLKFDGVASAMTTPVISFDVTNQMTVWGGMRITGKYSNYQVLVETSAVIGNYPSVLVHYDPFFQNPPNGLCFLSSGSPPSNYKAASPLLSDYPGKATYVVTGISSIPYPYVGIRLNGVLAAYNTEAQGSGNYYPSAIYIGARNINSYLFQGRIYSLIVRGAQSTNNEIARTEKWINSKTRAY